MYQEISSDAEIDNYKFIEFYFENFYARKILNSYEGEVSTIQLKWDQILDWTVAETFKDWSILLKWTDDGDEVSLINLNIIDVDTKFWTKLPYYDDEMLLIFKDYAEYVMNPEKYGK